MGTYTAPPWAVWSGPVLDKWRRLMIGEPSPPPCHLTATTTTARPPDAHFFLLLPPPLSLSLSLSPSKIVYFISFTVIDEAQ